MLSSLSVLHLTFVFCVTIGFTFLFILLNEKAFKLYLEKKGTTFFVLLTLFFFTALRKYDVVIYIVVLVNFWFITWILKKKKKFSVDYQDYIPLFIICIIWMSLIFLDDLLFFFSFFIFIKFELSKVETKCFDYHWRSDKDLIAFNIVYWGFTITTPLLTVVFSYFGVYLWVSELLIICTILLVALRVLLSVHVLFFRNPSGSEKLGAIAKSLVGIALPSLTATWVAGEAFTHSGQAENTFISLRINKLHDRTNCETNFHRELHDGILGLDKRYKPLLERYKYVDEQGNQFYSEEGVKQVFMINQDVRDFLLGGKEEGERFSKSIGQKPFERTDDFSIIEKRLEEAINGPINQNVRSMKDSNVLVFLSPEDVEKPLAIESSDLP